MLPLVATYLLLAAALAVADRFANQPLFIRTRSKHLPWKLNYSFKWWRTQEYLAAAIMGSVAALLLLLFWHTMGGSISREIAQIIFAVICASSTALSIKHFNLIQKFKAHIWWMTIAAALSTWFLGFVASAYADSFILNWTRVEATQFPLAQKALSALILVSLWANIAAMFISLGVGLTSVVIAARTPTFTGTVRKDPLKTKDSKRYKPGLMQRRHSRELMVLYTGAVFTVAITSSSLTSVLNHAEEALQETLVFASFHLRPSDCGIIGRGPGTWVALINHSQAVVATPSKKGYTFSTEPCAMQSEQMMRRSLLERSRQDDYQ
ncbi:hypothetical protein NLO95_06245 [Pseudomonas syringae]|nr:hypothetical protein [Pseudomonas syringae]